ncbi:MAG: OprO/OprP family phosphate-selective porin [Rikenellaceae bacterium]|nr:OprO/OprP family phosphate-selective porin [Rikenellaceae bacterium]
MLRRRATICGVLFLAALVRGYAQESLDEETISYRPEIFGAVKAKFETSLYDGAHWFNVRNSRMGVRGFASPNFKYAIQIDFSNEGKLSVLDSYVTYFSGQLEATIGQQQYRFSTDLDRGPNSTIFSNRSFLSKYLTTYYTSTVSGGGVGHTASSIGSRDLGALLRYRFKGAPVRFSVGAFNGSGTNNPEWDDNINLVGKIELGPENGLHGALSHYNGHTPAGSKAVVGEDNSLSTAVFNQRIRMWGAELSYTAEDWTVETEYAQRRLQMDGLRLLQAGHIQGFYRIGTRESSVFRYIAPLGRWDIGDKIEFIDMDGLLDYFSAHRATVGVNFGFTGKIIGTELRIQFEKYFVMHTPRDFSRNPLLQDKITIEVVASF